MEDANKSITTTITTITNGTATARLAIKIKKTFRTEPQAEKEPLLVIEQPIIIHQQKTQILQEENGQERHKQK